VLVSDLGIWTKEVEIVPVSNALKQPIARCARRCFVSFGKIFVEFRFAVTASAKAPAVLRTHARFLYLPWEAYTQCLTDHRKPSWAARRPKQASFRHVAVEPAIPAVEHPETASGKGPRASGPIGSRNCDARYPSRFR
jgi:hypothetical protein